MTEQQSCTRVYLLFACISHLSLYVCVCVCVFMCGPACVMCVCVCVLMEQYPTEEDMIEWAKRESEREEKERLARLTQQEQEDLELAIALSKAEMSNAWPGRPGQHTGGTADLWHLTHRHSVTR